MTAKLLKAEEVASILDISKSFVYQLIRTGAMRAVHMGTAVRVRQEDLEEFIKVNLGVVDTGYPVMNSADVPHQ